MLAVVRRRRLFSFFFLFVVANFVLSALHRRQKSISDNALSSLLCSFIFAFSFFLLNSFTTRRCGVVHSLFDCNATQSQKSRRRHFCHFFPQSLFICSAIYFVFSMAMHRHKVSNWTQILFIYFRFGSTRIWLNPTVKRIVKSIWVHKTEFKRNAELM